MIIRPEAKEVNCVIENISYNKNECSKLWNQKAIKVIQKFSTNNKTASYGTTCGELKELIMKLYADQLKTSVTLTSKQCSCFCCSKESEMSFFELLEHLTIVHEIPYEILLIVLEIFEEAESNEELL